MVEAILGSWQLVESENFEEYMKEVGVGIITRKAAAHLKPWFSLTRNGSLYTYDLRSTFKNHKFDFEIDKEFVGDTVDGRKLKTTFRVEGGKLVQYECKISDKDKDSTMTYYIDERGRLVILVVSGKVRCLRIFERAQPQ